MFLEPAAARLLLRHLIGLATLCRQRDLRPEDVIHTIDATLGTRGWSKDDVARWRDRAPTLVSLLKHVELVAKQVDLSYNYANLLESAQIITDIRPIYDDGHSKIIGGIVANILRISYFSEDGSHGLSVALDEDDLRRLQTACEEAQKKMTIAQHLLDENQLTVIKHGEDLNVFSDS